MLPPEGSMSWPGRRFLICNWGDAPTYEASCQSTFLGLLLGASNRRLFTVSAAPIAVS
jgi:hypothetical protein